MRNQLKTKRKRGTRRINSSRIRKRIRNKKRVQAKTKLKGQRKICSRKRRRFRSTLLKRRKYAGIPRRRPALGMFDLDRAIRFERKAGVMRGPRIPRL